MQIITKADCIPCTKLKNMLNKLDIGFNECTIDDVPSNYRELVTCYPSVFQGTNLLFTGAPGSVESLKKLLIARGVI